MEVQEYNVSQDTDWRGYEGYRFKEVRGSVWGCGGR